MCGAFRIFATEILTKVFIIRNLGFIEVILYYCKKEKQRRI